MTTAHKAKPNVMFYCPLCSQMDEHHQSTVMIDEEHFIFNCGRCENKSMIVRLR